MQAAVDVFVDNQDGGTACVGKSRHVRLNNAPDLPVEADIIFNIFFGEKLKICVLSPVECEQLPDHSPVINVHENYWIDKEGDLPYSVVPNSWHTKGYFPGTHLDYVDGAFVSNDFRARRRGSFVLYYMIQDSMGVMDETYLQISIVKDATEVVEIW